LLLVEARSNPKPIKISSKYRASFGTMRSTRFIKQQPFLAYGQHEYGREDEKIERQQRV